MGQIWEVNLNTFTLQNTIPLAIDDFTIDNGNEGRGLPNYIAGITIHPDNKSAWSVAKKDNILRGLSRDGKALVFDNSVRTAISPINLTTNKEELANRLDIDNHGQPSSALFTPTGNYLFVTMQGNNRIVVIDPKRGLELLKKDVGKAPQGITIDPSTNRVFVKNFMDRTVSVFDASDMITTGSNTLEELKTINTVTSETLSPVVLKGKQLFYDASDLRMGTDGYISCASCHIDGTQDGRIWDFTDRGEGLRNTISLIGRAGTGHGRVHWSANFDEIQDFENDIRFHFKGKGFMSDADFNKGTIALSLGDAKKGKSADLDALSDYIESLNAFEPSPYRNANGSLTADAKAGKSLFTDLKCASCHSGPNFTDSNTGKMHDVGTITNTSGNRLNKKLLGLDVPTLKDVWSTAPYLHNGAAKTLAEVFTTYNTGYAHAATAGLSAIEMKQLEAYLKQIDGSEEASVSQQIVEIASPEDGLMIDKADPVKLSINTNIQGVTKVAYYIDNVLVDEVTTAPFESSWTPIIWKTYTITAKVFYNTGKTASITPEVNVKFKNTIKVLFVVGDKDNLSSEDQRIKSRLEQTLGFEMTVFSDDETTSPQVANPFDLVLVSSTVDPRVLGNDLEAARVPLMTWNPFMYGKLKLTTGELNTGFGFTQEGYSNVTISNPTHPMAVGLGTSTSLYSITQSLPFGKPTAEAIVIAKAGTSPILFGYEASISIPSRRVAFPLRDQFMHLLTNEGLKMFDAAVLWTLHGGDADTPIGPLPDVFFESPLDGELVNAPLTINFKTEGWSIPSQQYKLRFKIDGQDRGLVTAIDGMFIDPTDLPEGPHELTLQMERSDNSLTDLGETITVIVTNDPLPQDPTVMIQSPTNGGLVGPDFEIEFTTIKWDIAPGGQSIKYFIDGEEKGAVFEVAPIPVSNLPEGEHTIKFALANADGTLFGEPTQITITVDNRINNLPDTPYSVAYRNDSSGASTAELKPIFQIVSEATEAVSLSDFKMRYWFTPENNAAMVANVDYSAVTGTTTNFDVIDTHTYLEVGFSATSGSLSAGKTGEIQTRLHTTGYQTQDQRNDFSYDPGKTVLTPHVLVTLYYKGELVWGLEPTGTSVPNPNSKPTAIIATNVTQGLAPLLVNFDGNGSTDPDGDALTYSWNFGNTETAIGAIASTTYQQAGTYEALLTVDDGNGNVDSQEVTIVVTNPQIVLEASFTATPTSGSTPLLVDFDASSSTFPANAVITYTWDFGDGTTGAGETVSHTYTQSGSYATTLTISDGVTSDISEIVTITVTEIDVPVATARITADVTTGTAPTIINFDASASTISDNSVLSFTWDFGDGTTDVGATVSHEYTAVGEYVVTVRAANADGIFDTATETITINPSPGGGESCTFGAPLSTALPTIENASYTNVHVLGTRGPDLSNVTNFTINWSLENNGLWQLSMNTNNGVPSWWMDLKANITVQNFNISQPSVTFLGTGIANLDGEYYATQDQDNFILVAKNLSFTLYFSNNAISPNCGDTALKIERVADLKIDVYPNPFVDQLNLSSPASLKGATIRIFDLNGRKVHLEQVSNDSKRINIKMDRVESGVYFVEIIQYNERMIYQIIK